VTASGVLSPAPPSQTAKPVHDGPSAGLTSDEARARPAKVGPNAMPDTSAHPLNLVKLSLGGVVAADVHLTGESVELDQSMLTGESLPIEAGAGVDAYDKVLV